MAIALVKVLKRLAVLAIAFPPGAFALEDEPDALPGSVYEAFEPDETDADDAADDDSETVVNAVAAALSHDPQIAVALSRRDSAAADRFRAFGQFLPEIEATAAYTDEDWRSDSLQTLQDRDGTTVGITAVQPIFQGLTTINRFREARARLSQSDLLLLAARQETALQAAQAHADAILGREIVAHRLENLQLLERQLEIADRRQKAGAQSRTGVEQAKMRVAQAQVDLGAARAGLAQREAAYKRITGRNPPAEFVADREERIGEIATLDDALALAREFNPAINAAMASHKAAQYAKRAAAGDFAPRFTVEGSYLRRFGEDEMVAGDDEEYQLVARMRMPLFNQGRNIAGLRSAGASVSAEQAQVVITRLAVDEIVTRAWRQLTEAKTRRIAAQLGIEAATQSVKGLQLEYEAGQRTLIDVLDGQRDLVLAQISLSQATFDVRAAAYELAAAAGLILEAFGLPTE